ncbi:DUF6587 family protein [Xylella fastidiosa]|nr:DUF6587 family protein [Xylella fastidiosa]UIX80189.1 hypothetical protein LZ756_06600 [Xylella fastidiosa subsp. sandyi]
MSVSLLLQYVVIALAVLVSVFVVVRKYLPGTWGRVCGVLGGYLTRPGLPVWIQRLGYRLVPRMRRVGACHGCDNCTSGSGGGGLRGVSKE